MVRRLERLTPLWWECSNQEDHREVERWQRISRQMGDYQMS
jgi:hypothetical protein